jgi:hypothetical protein
MNFWNWLFIATAFSSTFWILYVVFSYRSVKKEMKKSVWEDEAAPYREPTSLRAQKTSAKLRAKMGVSGYSNNISLVYKHIGLFVLPHEREVIKLKKLYRFTQRTLAKNGLKSVESGEVISLIHNMISIKNDLPFASFNIAQVPTILEVAQALKENVSSNRIIKLYAQGLSLENIVQSKSIAEAHALALYK